MAAHLVLLVDGLFPRPVRRGETRFWRVRCCLGTALLSGGPSLSPRLLPRPKGGPPGPRRAATSRESPARSGAGVPRARLPLGLRRARCACLAWDLGTDPRDCGPSREAAGVLSQVTAVSFGDAAGVSPQVESRGPGPTQRSGLPAPAPQGLPRGLWPHGEGLSLGTLPPTPGSRSRLG